MESTIRKYRGLVHKAARLHWSKIKDMSVGILDFDDLVQVGNIALFHALKRFKPEQGLLFPYLWKTIYLRMQMEISTHNHMLKVSAEFKRLASKIYASDEPRDAELWAKRLGCTVNFAQDLINYLDSRWISFDAVQDNDGDDFALHERIGFWDEETDAGWERIDRLCKNDFEKQIIRLIAEGYTQKEISTITGRPEYSVWKAFRSIRQRYSIGGIADEQGLTPKKKKKARRSTAVHG